MSKRLLDYDPLRGVTEFIHYDHQTGASWIETVEDETALFEANQREYNSHLSNGGWGDGGSLTGSNRYLRLSDTMMAKLIRSGILMDPQLLMAWADTAEARPYRTRPGRLTGTGRQV